MEGALCKGFCACAEARNRGRIAAFRSRVPLLCLLMVGTWITAARGDSFYEVVAIRNYSAIPYIVNVDSSGWQICIGEPPLNLFGCTGCSLTLVGVGILRLADCDTAMNLTIEDPWRNRHVLVGPRDECTAEACETVYRVHIQGVCSTSLRSGTTFSRHFDRARCSAAQGKFPAVRLYAQANNHCPSSTLNCSVFDEVCVDRLSSYTYRGCRFVTRPQPTTEPGPLQPSSSSPPNDRQTTRLVLLTSIPAGLFLLAVLVTILVLRCGRRKPRRRRDQVHHSTTQSPDQLNNITAGSTADQFNGNQPSAIMMTSTSTTTHSCTDPPASACQGSADDVTNEQGEDPAAVMMYQREASVGVLYYVAETRSVNVLCEPVQGGDDI